MRKDRSRSNVDCGRESNVEGGQDCQRLIAQERRQIWLGSDTDLNVIFQPSPALAGPIETHHDPRGSPRKGHVGVAAHQQL